MSNGRRTFAEDFMWMCVGAACAFVAFAIVGSKKACAQTIGAHVATGHFKAGSHTGSPGLYVRFASGVVVGGYRNSLTTPERRTSFYVAQTWEFDRYALLAGVVSGYHVEEGECGRGCVQKWGHTRGRIGPLVAASVSFPEARPLLGVTPRLTLIPAGVHLSFERSL
jgi:hypothetical protein